MALFAFCISLSLQITISALMDSTTLIPSNPYVDGATVSCTHHDCSVVNDHWLFSHLHIDLDSSWNFHPTQPSVISFTFYAASSIPSSFVFSINNDPYIVFNSNASVTCTTNIFDEATDSLQNSSFPITITITNNPIAHHSFIVISSSTNTKTCGYDDSFSTNHGLQIRISANKMREFTQIDISHGYGTNSLHPYAATMNPRIISLIAADNVTINMSSFTLILVIVVLVLCSVFSCICFFVYKARGRRRHRSTTEQVVPVVVQMQHTAPQHTSAAFHGEFHQQINNNIKQQKDMELALLAAWLENDVGLPQYYALLVKKGYDSTKLVSGIESKSQLKKIGIHVLGHQTLIWGQIKKLKEKYSNVHSALVSTSGFTTGGTTNTPLHTTDTNVYHFGYAPTDLRAHDGQRPMAMNANKAPNHQNIHQQPWNRKHRETDSSLWGDAPDVLPPSMVKKQKTPDFWGEHQTLPASRKIFGGRMFSSVEPSDSSKMYDNPEEVGEINTQGFIQ